jgi:hypothetical protein
MPFDISEVSLQSGFTQGKRKTSGGVARRTTFSGKESARPKGKT